TSSVIGSGWTNDTATIREDDETQDHSPVHKSVTSSDTTEQSANTTQQTNANNGVQEVTHEMSTEL
ncbi:hypothetical protein L9F63_001654, partial [Diploptera punctata]